MIVTAIWLLLLLDLIKAEFSFKNEVLILKINYLIDLIIQSQI